MTELPSPVTVIGAGTMGAGMAAVFALHGVEVRLAARRESSLAAAAARVGAISATLGGSPGEVAGRVSTTTDLAVACTGAALVIETIAEDLEEKRTLLGRVEQMVAPETVIVTNTSSLPLAALSEALVRPDRFAGFHWFNPPELVDLVEVVGGPVTEPAVVARLVAWTGAIGKTPAVVRRDTPGFIANRLQYALLREAWALVEAGVCSFEDVDLALTHGLGARWAAIGPFQTVDLAGLDVHLAVAHNLYPVLSTETSPPAALEAAVADGALGCKGGRGLLGDYGDARVAGLIAQRERMLRAIATAREPGRS